ncbi:MAG: sulfotransferase [Candidatus Sedimenticola sp. (ex Thyasira tokunagai)]
MARSVFLSGIKEANSQGKIAVISDETLGGDPLRGWINPKVIAERIHQTFPEARILICIREQKSTLHSLYSEYIKHGHTGKLQDFIGTTGEHLGKAPICDIAQLEYDRLIDHYHTLFGKEQVTVLTFENFLANKKAFLQQLLSAANPDITLPDFSISHKIENSSLGPATLNLRRIFNNISRSPDWSLPRQPFTFRLNQKASSILDRIIPEQYQAATKVTNKRVIDDFIGDRYRASNKRTIELTGLDLSALGYET